MAETRLLHNVTTVGEVSPDAARASDNLLIRGDALHGLTSLLDLPEFGRIYAGKVRLCYIDPPFNTGQLFHGHYDDALEHSVWLTMLRDRLLQIRRLLSPNGSVWVHLDDREVHRARCVLDELFGPDNFVATVMWKRRNDPRNTAVHLSADHDFLLVYAVDIGQLGFNKLSRTAAMDAAYTNPDEDSRGPWRRSDLAARNYYSKGLYPVTTPSGRLIEGPPSGSYWRVSEHELKRLDADGRVYWGIDGSSRPYLKRFLAEVSAGRVASTIWPPEEVGFVRNGKEEVRALVGDVFATPKPEGLMARVLELASDEDDLVLDCFLGSGTTAAVAHKMGRRWVGIEWSADTVTTFALPRLTKVVNGEDSGGVTAQTGWEGGGGFRVLDVAPSMFEDDAGRVVLADWATNGALAEATAAQLGFDYDEQLPFCGRKGRTKLAVVDGLVGEEVIRILAGALGEGERAVVCGTAIDPAARSVLKGLRPGSTMRKIPSSILEEYRQQRRARSQLVQVIDGADALALVQPANATEVASLP